MDYRYDDQQQREQLLTIVDRGTSEQLFAFLQGFHRRPFQSMVDVLEYAGVIDDQIDFIDCTGTRYNVTPLIIAAGKGLYEKTKILLAHGANPNKQCATGDTALNLAVHRQKYPIVDLLLQYSANPNLYNRAGKTALHRAVLSYTNENVNHIQTLLNAGADQNIEDRNQRIPLDEAVINNRPEIIDILLSHDRTLIDRAYRAAIIASRLGRDKCLETLLNYGMDPNISDRTNTTPLHVAIRSLKLSTVRLLVANGADQNIANNRGETATSIAKYLQPDQQQIFIDALTNTALSDFHPYKTGNAMSYVYPLLRSHPNWTLDSDEFRSSTAENSSVQNLLDTSDGTYWCCPQSRNAWIIFDLKREYNIAGVRIIGCENASTPKNGHVDVSNALNGPWLKVKDLICLITQGNKNDFLFPSLKTRFIRVFISDNYGAEDIRIEGIGFFGVDMRLVDLLKEYGLENSLNTLLANDINDQEILYEHQDEILNSSDKYLHVNDHFKFIRLTEALRSPQLTFLEWFNPPQTTVIAGERFRTFSVVADEGLTDRVKLEEKLENNPQAKTILMKDLEPIQGYSLVDFSEYTIKDPGRYKIRIVSVDSPDIHTSWEEIVVGSTLPYAHKLKNEGDERLYLSSTTRFFNETTSDKENALFAHKLSTTTSASSSPHKDNRAFVTNVYESESDETEDDTYLVSLKSVEDSPYNFTLTNMSSTTDSTLINYRPDQQYRPEHSTQTKPRDFYDHSTNTDEDFDEGYNSSSRLNSKPSPDIYLTPSKYRSVSRTPLSNIFPYSSTNSQKQSDDDDMINYGDKIIIPTKYRLQQDRINRLLNDENTNRLQQPTQNQESSQEQQSQYNQRQKPQKRTQSVEELSPQKQQQSNHRSRHQSHQRNQSPRELSPEQIQSRYYDLDQSKKRTKSREESPSRQHQSQYQQRNQSPEQIQSHYYDLDQSKKRTKSREESPSRQHQSQYQQRKSSRQRTDSGDEDESLQQKSEYYGRGQLQNQNTRVQTSLSSSPPTKQQSDYEPKEQAQQRIGSARQPSPPPKQQSHYEPKEQPRQQNGSARQPSPPPKQQSHDEPKEQLRQQNVSPRELSPPPQQQQEQSNYYELELSPEQNEPVRESPLRQPLRRRTDSGDEPLQQHLQYYGQGQGQGQGQLHSQNTRTQSASPPPKEQSHHKPREQTRQQNGSATESSPPPQQHSNYYELNQTPKRIQPTRESPVRQHQSPYYEQQKSRQRNDTELRSTPPPQVKQQSHKRNESEYDFSYVRAGYDQPLEPQTNLDDETPTHHHRMSTDTTDEDNFKPLYNRFHIIAGDLELRESPSDNSLYPNESKAGQMQLIFRATVQGLKVQERANNSMRNLLTNQSRTQSTSSIYNQANIDKTPHSNLHQSPINADRRNQNSTNIPSSYERAPQTGSNQHSRLNSISQTAQSSPERKTRDHDKHTNIESNSSLQPSSSPRALRKKQSQNDRSSPTDANHQTSDQSPLHSHPPPSNIDTHTEKDDDLDGIRERSRSSSENRSSPKREKTPLKKSDNSHSSPLLTSPKASPVTTEHQATYFFGENAENPPSDEDSDEADCEMFGHNSQPRPLTNITARRSLDYPSTTIARFPSQDSIVAGTISFSGQTNTGTATENSLTQQRRRSSSPNSSTIGKTGNPLQYLQAPTSNKQTPPRTDHQIPDAYSTMTNYDSLNQNASNQTASTTGFPQNYPSDSNNYEQNIGSNINQEQSPSRSNQIRHQNKQSQDEDDDTDEYQDDDDNDDVHDPVHDDSEDRNYVNEDDDDNNNNLPRDDETSRSSVPRSSGVDQLVQRNPVRDEPTAFQPIQYPAMPPPAILQPDNNSSMRKPEQKRGFFGFFRSSKNKTKVTKQKSNKKGNRSNPNDKKIKR